jgi:hypothetical protein
MSALVCVYRVLGDHALSKIVDFPIAPTPGMVVDYGDGSGEGERGKRCARPAAGSGLNSRGAESDYASTVSARARQP